MRSRQWGGEAQVNMWPNRWMIIVAAVGAQDELASAAPTVIEKSFAEKQGKNDGTRAGPTMCTRAG
jgi:hypothetical protein